jgi:hypothetical protein
MATSFPFDAVRTLIEENYKAEGDDDGEPMVVGTVVISAVVSLSDGTTKSLFLHDGGWDESLGLARRQMLILESIDE